MAKELSQPETRTYRTYFDQHDRKWGVTIDKRTGHAAGPWEPLFTAPWYPDAKYIRHHPTDDRLILIDYGRNVRDLREAAGEYDDFRLRVAMNEYGSAFTSKLGKSHDEDPPELKKLVGQPPFPFAYPEAAQAGNKWVLGFSDTIPRWAYVFLAQNETPKIQYPDADDEVEEAVDLDEQFDPEATGGKRVPVKSSQRGKSEYTAFVSEMSKEGKSLKEIASLWRERKAATV